MEGQFYLCGVVCVEWVLYAFLLVACRIKLSSHLKINLSSLYSIHFEGRKGLRAF